MKIRASTLLNPSLIFCVWLVLWAGRLWLIPVYYQRTAELGYYPPEADTIAIPIMQQAAATLFVGPFFAVILWLLLRRSPEERRNWLVWNRQYWLASLAFTVLFSVLALMTLPTLIEDIRIGLFFNAIADIIWFFFWLAVRAVVVSRIPPPPPAPDLSALERSMRQATRYS